MNKPLKTTDSSQLPITDVELRLVQARLLAIMSNADGRVVEIEKLLSESILELMDRDDFYKLKTLYEEELLISHDKNSVNEVLGFMKRATLKEKINLMQILSSLATCDGELHEREEKLLKHAMVQLQVIIGIAKN